MSFHQSLIFLCLLGNLPFREARFGLFLDDKKVSFCEQSSTWPHYGIVVTQMNPSAKNGKVLIQASVNRTISVNPICTWTYEVSEYEVPFVKQGLLASGSSLALFYSKPGLQEVSVTAQFDIQGKQVRIKNCSSVNVTECYITPKIRVSSLAGSYNISQNHTDVSLNSRGLVNFTIISISKIDPYFICKHFYFLWDLGDGFNASGKYIEHFYNKTGDYFVVLKIFHKVLAVNSSKELLRNFTIKVQIKGKDPRTPIDSSVVGISLVLTIFFACFVFVVCVAVYWFRRRLHQHTEVARFDFREAELQSSFDGRGRGRSPCRRKRLMPKLGCRRGSDEYLLNSEQPRYYLSCGRFHGDSPIHEEL